MVGPGNYDELLLSQTSSSTTCSPGDASAMPGCAPIPNGLSASQRTTLLGAGTDTVLSPVGKQLPGGGSAISLFDYARYIHIEGFTIVKNAAPSSVGGIYMGNVQSVTLTRNELDNGQIKGGSTSRYLTMTHNSIHDTGRDTCPQGVKPTPSQCPHGVYVCGTDHVFTDNVVQNASYYGVQFSCESGGLARIRIERNRVENSPVVGIRCGGTDCLVAANLLKGNGTGISISGSGQVINNTIDDYFHAAWNSDPWGIWVSYGDGSGFTMTNNLLTNQKSSYYAINNAAFAPISPALVHHNMCEASGSAGCTLIAQADAIYRGASAGDFTLRPGSPAIQAGVSTSVTKDLRSVSYPTPPDLGAYSSGAAPTPPPDTTPPAVAWTNPPNNEQVYGAALPLTATASDTVGVVSVAFSVDGVTLGEVTTSPYTLSWDTTTVANGNHTMTAIAVDSSGNQAKADRTLVVANPLPPEPAPGTPLLACTGTYSGGTFEMTCMRPPVQR